MDVTIKYDLERDTFNVELMDVEMYRLPRAIASLPSAIAKSYGATLSQAHGEEACVMAETALKNSLERACAGLETKNHEVRTEEPSRCPTFRKLAKSLGLPRETLKRALDQLAELGLLEVEQLGTTLPTAYELTEKGRGLLASISPALHTGTLLDPALTVPALLVLLLTERCDVASF